MLGHIVSYPVHLLLAHGYLALFLWSVLEGEIGLMLAGWLASKHMVFEYDKVVLTAIVGAFIGDMITFSFGRLFEKRAKRWLEKDPKRKRLARYLIRRWGALVIVFERFVYGTHIPVLLTLSMGGYPFAKFILFDIIGVVLWAFTFVSIGYFFGHSAIDLILLIQKNIFATLFILLVLLLLFKKRSQNRRRRK